MSIVKENHVTGNQQPNPSRAQATAEYSRIGLTKQFQLVFIDVRMPHSKVLKQRSDR